MLNKIWEKYFLSEFTKVFFLFLICFYGLYVLIDYSSHTSAFLQHTVQVQFKDLFRYYFYVLSQRAEILIPIALLIALVKTVTTLNIHHELVALVASGMNIKTLMRPFLLFGLFCTFCIYMNEQFILPTAVSKLRRIEDATKHQRSKNAADEAVHTIVLHDGSLLLYQSYDHSKEQFVDVYWIQTINNIYRMKALSPRPFPPKGYFVENLIRQANGELLQVFEEKELTFSELNFDNELLKSAILEPDALSLTELGRQLPKQQSVELDENESKTLTAFYWKLIMPWLCLLAIIAPVPFCVQFSRQVPLFMIYAISLFGLIAFYMLMDASQVIAKRQVTEPFLALCVPFTTVFAFFGWRYMKMC